MDKAETTTELNNGDKAVAFIERLKHVKGPLAGTRLILNDWQRDALRKIFGTPISEEDPRRLIREIMFFVPRKAGKTTLMAGVALFCLLCGGELGNEIYSCAADKEQAGLIYEAAKAMILADEELSALVRSRKIRIIDSKKTIFFRPTNSFYRVLSSDAFTKHGLNPNVVFFDELSQWPDRELYDVMVSGMGARTQPLIFITTTAWIYRPQSIGYLKYDYSRRVRDGLVKDPRHLPIIYEADPKDDPLDPETWKKCNPNLGKSNYADHLVSEAAQAKELPSELQKFKMAYLNQWGNAITTWIPKDKWDACDEKIDEAELLGKPCFGALDLAAVTDLAAFVMAFPRPENKVAFLLRAYIGIESAAKREATDKIPYSAWEKAGLVKFTPGEVTDYDFIREDLKLLGEKYQIKELAFDRFGATQLAAQLKSDGHNVIAFGQGFKDMSPPTKELERLIISRRIIHNGNPVAAEHICNAVAVRDAADNIKIDKSKANRRIDVVIALLMALGRLMAAPVELAGDGKLEDYFSV